MISHLKIEHFRNHNKYSLDFDQTTVLIGKNGIGKTNILEAITLISFGRSFREDDRKNLIMFDEDWARVTLSASAEISKSEFLIPNQIPNIKSKIPNNAAIQQYNNPPTSHSELAEESQNHVSGKADGDAPNNLAIHQYNNSTPDTFEIFMQRRPRLLTKIKQRGVAKRMSEVVGQLPSVVFSPETLNIITGEPGERRRFLDIAISQIDRKYLKDLSNYTKVRRQRNKLLERVREALAGEVELTYWDEQLAEYGDAITAKRYEAIAQFNQKLADYYQTISGDNKAVVKIEYYAKAGDDLKKKLKEHRHTEIASGTTIFGPHRDELVFKINNRDMAHYASRGETRSAILALKVAELDYLETERKKYPEIYDSSIRPILLLDDVYSEFDSDRRSHLAKLIESYQTLITTTDREHLSKVLLKKAKVVEL